MDTFLLTPALTTHRGMRREKNEDAVAYAYPTDPARLTSHGALFVIADGVGGRDAGEEASEYAARELAHVYYDLHEPNLEKRLVEAVRIINETLYHRSGEAATTLTAAVIHAHRLIIAHVGDSCAYWLDESGLRKLTEDHVFVADPAQPHKRKLSRAIGHKESVKVDTVTGAIRSGGRLIMVTDGITRYLDDARLYNLAMIGTPAEAVRDMVEEANAAGGVDNSSAVIVEVGLPCRDADLLHMHQSALQPFVVIPDAAGALLTDVDTHPRQYPPVYHDREDVLSEPPRRESAYEARLPDTPQGDETHILHIPSREPARRRAMTLPLAALLLLGIALVGAALFWPRGGDNVEVQADSSPTAGEMPGETATATETPSPTPPASSPVPTLDVTGTLAAATRAVTLTLSPLNAPLSEGMTLLFRDSALTYTRVGSGATAFTLNPDEPIYQVAETFTDRDNVTWYRLFNIESEQYGWIPQEALPDYEVVP